MHFICHIFHDIKDWKPNKHSYRILRRGHMAKKLQEQSRHFSPLIQADMYFKIIKNENVYCLITF